MPVTRPAGQIEKLFYSIHPSVRILNLPSDDRCLRFVQTFGFIVLDRKMVASSRASANFMHCIHVVPRDEHQ